MDTQQIRERLGAVRGAMQRLDLDALIVPRADEYLGEYLPAHHERLRWISGFSGSAGIVIVMHDSAAIFVDGRYTVQVRQQVPAELFEFLHLVDEPHARWLGKRLGAGMRVGYDPRMHTLSWQRRSSEVLEECSVALVALEENPIDRAWHDRPVPEIHPAVLMEQRFTGRASLDKRREIGALITEKGADAALIFAADSIAWLLNIRGSDVPHVPVVLGYALLTANGNLQFFTDPEKIPPGFASHVGAGVEVLAESRGAQTLASLGGRKIIADPDTANAWCQLLLESSGARLIATPDPVLLPKACKNAAEIDGMRRAHIRDAVAECRFLAWLDAEVAAGRLHDEATLCERLFEFRAGDELFRELSFDTISAAGANAAMCHYRHSDTAPGRLSMDSVYLVDSGAQYLDGTTDITRTVAIGDPGPGIRHLATLVLKGHIALDQARFPKGTTGTQLDVLARQFLWQQGFDYDHGTGHGVGSFLSVHEGPQRIGKGWNASALAPGMVISNEPGYYRAGCFGIRHENLLLVTEAEVSAGGEQPMYGFEALTLVPFDRRLLDDTLLSAAEIAWLNRYHQRVATTIAPLLEGSDREWLREATRPLS
ncbi:MAG: aminopeptidase P family protein [Gammaproteobacteria bacterium]|nr:aminopeptidase P family protein [Gammaproteobacteria bacterium]